MNNTGTDTACMLTESKGSAKRPSAAIGFFVEKLDLFNDVDLLLSSPGRVDVADKMKERCPSAVITCVEPKAAVRHILRQRGYDIIEEGNLLKINCWPSFDRIALIPPTTTGQCVEHVRHALTMLKPGGRLVTGITERSVDQTRSLQKLLKEVSGEIEYLPSGLLFENHSSVTARAYLVIITKPEESTKGSTVTAAEGKVITAKAAGA